MFGAGDGARAEAAGELGMDAVPSCPVSLKTGGEGGIRTPGRAFDPTTV